MALGLWFLTGALCFACPVIYLIVWILIGVWVYRDAESRGASGILWLIVVFVLNIIGIIIYLIVRPKQKVGVPPPGYAPPPGTPPPQAPPPQ